jgi:branched-chain amino acid transport system permease protein
MRATFDPYAGPIQLIFAFEALIIGGSRSLWGTLWGGILLGVAQAMGAKLHPLGFLIAGHLVFLAFLLLRLYGRPRILRRPKRQPTLAKQS